ncbi:MAG TPA: signal peptidase I [Bacillota bacterium]|nr:signal peptidase I [Bacillota bacterium]
MQKSFWREWLLPFLLAMVFAFFIRSYIGEARSIPSGSMEPTLKIKDMFFVEKLSYRFGEMERGDIIVFWPPEKLQPDFPYVKRLIALAGETVEIRDGIVYVDGIPLNEPYAEPWRGDFGPLAVPEGHMFVLGDNRPSSADSREWGLAETDHVVGRGVFIIWPLNRISVLK